MKTDTIFYQLFQSFPSIFFELIQLPISEANNYRFDSVEVKQLSFRLDGVFLPQNNHRWDEDKVITSPNLNLPTI